MQLALYVKKKTGFINVPLPKSNGIDPQLLNLWNRSNYVVISRIFNSVSKDTVAKILHSDAATEVWKDLHEQF